jgi:GT2 family glycosyltransferase
MISIVTITFNNPDELKATLQSLSVAKGIESVVVNGGAVLESGSLPRIPETLIQEKDRGISDAFNKGWRNSTGLAVAYLNSGDRLLSPDFYERAEGVLKANPDIGFVYADLRFIHSRSGAYRMTPRGRGHSDLGKGMPFPHPSMVVRREIFEKIGGFSEAYRIAMDFDFVVRLLQAGYVGHYLPGEVVEMDGAGVSSTREGEGIGECRKSLVENGCYRGKIRWDFFMRMVRYRVRMGLQCKIKLTL